MPETKETSLYQCLSCWQSFTKGNLRMSTAGQFLLKAFCIC